VLTGRIWYRSLSQDDIPAKLRCAICSKLALNAFRLPCCEQAICENCHSTLPASCPVCEHSPLSADDCKPHKALRTTIKVFLRTEEKKRESSRPKDATPVTPVEPSPVSAVALAAPEFNAPEPAENASASPSDEHHRPSAEGPGTEAANGAADDKEGAEIAPSRDAENTEQATNEDVILDFSKTYIFPTVLTLNQEQQPSQEGRGGETEANSSNELVLAQENAEGAEGENAEDGKEEGDEMVEGQQPDGSNRIMNNGNFPNMGFNGGAGFDQMQMMMAMQNGFGNFPMMGTFYLIATTLSVVVVVVVVVV